MNKWEQEPTEKLFKYNDFNCAIYRNKYLKNLCGYVQIPNNHPLYKVEYSPYNNEIIDELNVHGGITFTGEMDQNGGWWIGFDCGHCGDLLPIYLEYFDDNIFKSFKDMDFHYWAMEEVEEEIKRLVDQITLIKKD